MPPPVRFYGGVFLRGLCMGAADLVPGVSGGTIAFISGIYQRLLTALAAAATAEFWRAVVRLQIAACWRLVDGNFLAALFAGILSAVILLAGALHHLLETQPHLLLGYFCGLVLASVFIVGRQLRGASAKHIGGLVAAAVLTFILVTIPPTTVDLGLPFLFFGGMIAISAMLLPGISGSYILLMLNLYPTVITAVHERDLLVLAVFAAGCGGGILLFSRLLAALLKHRYLPTMSVLVGVMIGALPKLWPWKEHADGAKIILQKNVAAADFAGDAQVLWVVLLAALGALSVLAVERLARSRRGE